MRERRAAVEKGIAAIEGTVLGGGFSAGRNRVCLYDMGMREEE